MDVSVIIVNWNSQAYVRQCLTSLFTHCRSQKLEVLVVDGASFDGCDEMLAREFPSVRFVQSPVNVGFARANNLGARHAIGRHLLLLNPDTEFIEDSLSSLVARLESLPGAVAVGCRLLNRDRTLQKSCVQSFPTVLNQMLDSEFLRRRFPRSRLWGMAALERTEPTEVEVLSGACILVRRECFERIGGFTERYFMYGEDLDLCFKLRKAGGRVYHVPDTSLVHFGGGSTAQAASNFSTVMMRDSVYKFIRFNRSLPSALAYRFSMTVTALVRLALMAPLMLFGRRIVRHGSGSWRKWGAILRWSVGFSPGRPAAAPAAPAVLAPTRPN
jgi:GT2 family glycosyltransferase